MVKLQLRRHRNRLNNNTKHTIDNIMKRIMIALAVLLSVQLADAQVKSPADAKKAVESAAEAAANPKKATKVATWMKLADSYLPIRLLPAQAGSEQVSRNFSSFSEMKNLYRLRMLSLTGSHFSNRYMLPETIISTRAES